MGEGRSELERLTESGDGSQGNGGNDGVMSGAEVEWSAVAGRWS